MVVVVVVVVVVVKLGGDVGELSNLLYRARVLAPR